MSTSTTMPTTFEIILTFQGNSKAVQVSTSTTGWDLHQQAMEVFGMNDNSHGDNTERIDRVSFKILYKGKRVAPTHDILPFEKGAPTKTPKIVIMATRQSSIMEIANKRSDPTIRGMEEEKRKEEATLKLKNKRYHWAEEMTQNKDFKFCRFQTCTWQSFGHRPTEKTPHDFEAMRLLEKLAADPGIVAIMKERELVVGTLGEMDPIDDRLMQKKQQEGGCLLGYNTNGGARIDIKLRTDDLQSFRPYPELVSTLIHELSHNWVSAHDLLFWTNYAQMKSEYLYTHAQLRSTIVRGKTTAELAGLDKKRLDNVLECIMNELMGEMRQHGLHPRMIEAPIRQRIQELEASRDHGKRLGGATSGISSATDTQGLSARELALAAAERRAQEQQKRSDPSHSPKER
mmetsp:Transcript_5250/g.9195  ORF Transcript_5250/g.9195 Transcript_5250/m.9195 type:complete len:402 (-) Transcript_5250:89-1294(-)